MKIIFHNSLVKFTNHKEINISCNDASDVVSAISNLFPELNSFISNQRNKTVFLLDENKNIITIEKLKTNVIHVVPLIGGSAAVLPVLAGFGANAIFAAKSKVLGLIAGALAATLVGGIIQIISPDKDKKSEDSDTRVENNLFDGLKNTTSSENFLPLNYGQVRVAGQLINGFIKSTKHEEEGFSGSVRNVLRKYHARDGSELNFDDWWRDLYDN